MTQQAEREPTIAELRAEVDRLMKVFWDARSKLYDKNCRPVIADDPEGTREAEVKTVMQTRRALRDISQQVAAREAAAREAIEDADESPLSLLSAAVLEEVRHKSAMYAEDARYDQARFIRQAGRALRMGFKTDMLAYARAIRQTLAENPGLNAGVLGSLRAELDAATTPEHVQKQRADAEAQLKEALAAQTRIARHLWELDSTGKLGQVRSLEAVIRSQPPREPAGHVLSND